MQIFYMENKSSSLKRSTETFTVSEQRVPQSTRNHKLPFGANCFLLTSLSSPAWLLALFGATVWPMENKTLFLLLSHKSVQHYMAVRASQGCNQPYSIPGPTWNQEERFAESELYCFANVLSLSHGNLLIKGVFAFFA